MNMRLLHLPSLLLAAPMLAEVHHWIPDQYYKTFSHTHAVGTRIKPGDTVVTKTIDSGGLDFKDEQKAPGPGFNPLTGPFYVEGAAPGDALVVKLRKIRMNRKTGRTGYRLLTQSVLSTYVESFYQYGSLGLEQKAGRNLPWDLDIERNTVKLREPVSKRIKLEFPARPMLGCIGVAAPG